MASGQRGEEQGLAEIAVAVRHQRAAPLPVEEGNALRPRLAKGHQQVVGGEIGKGIRIGREQMHRAERGERIDGMSLDHAVADGQDAVGVEVADESACAGDQAVLACGKVRDHDAAARAVGIGEPLSVGTEGEVVHAAALDHRRPIVIAAIAVGPAHAGEDDGVIHCVDALRGRVPGGPEQAPPDPVGPELEGKASDRDGNASAGRKGHGVAGRGEIDMPARGTAQLVVDRNARQLLVVAGIKARSVDGGRVVRHRQVGPDAGQLDARPDALRQ